MASSYSAAIAKFAKKHGPAGDTKYDIFDKSGMTRAQMRKARTTKVKRYPQQHAKAPRRLRPPSTRTQGGEIV